MRWNYLLIIIATCLVRQGSDFSPASSQQSCPLFWQQIDPYCYKLMEDYDYYQKFCKDQGGRLPEFPKSEQIDHLKSTGLLESGKRAFIGLKTTNLAGTTERLDSWKWVSSGLDLTYDDKWKANKPDNWGDRPQLCGILISSSSTIEFEDMYCHNSLTSDSNVIICQREIENGMCPDSWQSNDNQFCYRKFDRNYKNKESDFGKSEDLCNGFDARLPQFSMPGSYGQLRNEFKEIYDISASEYVTFFFGAKRLSGSSDSDPNGFTWLTDGVFEATELYWGTGEPNNYMNTTEDCVSNRIDAKWNDAQCSKKKRIVCQIEWLTTTTAALLENYFASTTFNSKAKTTLFSSHSFASTKQSHEASKNYATSFSMHRFTTSATSREATSSFSENLFGRTTTSENITSSEEKISELNLTIATTTPSELSLVSPKSFKYETISIDGVTATSGVKKVSIANAKTDDITTKETTVIDTTTTEVKITSTSDESTKSILDSISAMKTDKITTSRNHETYTAISDTLSATATEGITFSTSHETTTAISATISATTTEGISSTTRYETTVAVNDTISATTTDAITFSTNEGTTVISDTVFATTNEGITTSTNYEATAISDTISATTAAGITTSTSHGVTTAISDTISATTTECIPSSASDKTTTAIIDTISATTTEGISSTTSHETTIAINDTISATTTEGITPTTSHETTTAISDTVSTTTTEGVPSSTSDETTTAISDTISATTTERITTSTSHEATTAISDSISATTTEGITTSTSNETTTAICDRISATTTEGITTSTSYGTTTAISDTVSAATTEGITTLTNYETATAISKTVSATTTDSNPSVVTTSKINVITTAITGDITFFDEMIATKFYKIIATTYTLAVTTTNAASTKIIIAITSSATDEISISIFDAIPSTTADTMTALTNLAVTPKLNGEIPINRPTTVTASITNAIAITIIDDSITQSITNTTIVTITATPIDAITTMSDAIKSTSNNVIGTTTSDALTPPTIVAVSVATNVALYATTTDDASSFSKTKISANLLYEEVFSSTEATKLFSEYLHTTATKTIERTQATSFSGTISATVNLVETSFFERISTRIHPDEEFTTQQQSNNADSSDNYIHERSQSMLLQLHTSIGYALKHLEDSTFETHQYTSMSSYPISTDKTTVASNIKTSTTASTKQEHTYTKLPGVTTNQVQSNDASDSTRSIATFENFAESIMKNSFVPRKRAKIANSVKQQHPAPLTGAEAIAATVMHSLGYIWLIGIICGTILIAFILRLFGYLRILHLMQELGLLFACVVLLLAKNIESEVTCRLASALTNLFFVMWAVFCVIEAIFILCLLSNVINSSGEFYRTMSITFGIGVTCILAATSLPGIMRGSVNPSCWMNWSSQYCIVTQAATIFAITFASVAIAESGASFYRPPIPLSNMAERSSALPCILGIIVKAMVGMSSYILGSMALYYQQIGLFVVVFGLNIALGVAIFIFHVMADAKMKVIAIAGYQRIRGSLNT